MNQIANIYPYNLNIMPHAHSVACFYTFHSNNLLVGIFYNGQLTCNAPRNFSLLLREHWKSIEIFRSLFLSLFDFLSFYKSVSFSLSLSFSLWLSLSLSFSLWLFLSLFLSLSLSLLFPKLLHDTPQMLFVYHGYYLHCTFRISGWNNQNLIRMLFMFLQQYKTNIRLLRVGQKIRRKVMEVAQTHRKSSHEKYALQVLYHCSYKPAHTVIEDLIKYNL